jgi:hypothetical protein
VSSLGAVLALGTPVAAAPDDDGSVNSRVAEAQFLIYLLTNTDLRPTDITCTQPPTQDAAGDMLCFALVDGRETIAALATLESPGVYSFTAISKSDTPVTATTATTTPPPPTLPPVPTGTPTDPSTTPTTAGQSPTSDPDQAILDAVAQATTTESSATTEVLLSYLGELASVDSYSYHEPTSTLQIRATSSTTDPARRDEMAWSITDTMAYLWETSMPLRDPNATIRPRLEVILDEEIYGTPYDVMVRIADYDIEFSEWLAITTGTNALTGDVTDNGRDAIATIREHSTEAQRRAEQAPSEHVELPRHAVGAASARVTMVV